MTDEHLEETRPVLWAGTRDASWYNRPSVDGPVKFHVVVDAHFPACNQGGVLISDYGQQPAADVPDFQRCGRPGCKLRWPQ